MATITIHKAKTQLSKLIARGKEPVARLTPVAKVKERLPAGIVKGKRVPGLLKGKVSLPDSFFFDPLPEEELKLWEGSNDDPLR